MKINITLKLCFSLIFANGLFAQQGFVTTGTNATGSGGTVSYSVGQIDYKSPTGSGEYLIEGLQQPFEISEITGIEETAITLSSSLYPNPSHGALVLKIQSGDFSGFNYYVYDQHGKVIMNKRMESSETLIDLSAYPNAPYFLKVFNSEKELKTYQVLKLK